MADGTHQRKVQDHIQQTVARLPGRRIKGPRLGFVVITGVHVTDDLQHASIFYTVLGDDEDRRVMTRTFELARGTIRSEVGKALGTRLTPAIELILDALPDPVATIGDAFVAAEAKGEQITRHARGTAYTGDGDPYRHDDTGEDAP